HRHIQPVLLIDRALRGDFDGISGLEIVETDGVFARRLVRLAGRVCKHAFAYDPISAVWYRRAHVELASHVPLPGRISRLPLIYWIPDLQHRRLPHLFSAFERWVRDQLFTEALREAVIVVTSSRACADDLVAAYGTAHSNKIRVLHFVSQPRVAADRLPPLPY